MAVCQANEEPRYSHASQSRISLFEEPLQICSQTIRRQGACHAGTKDQMSPNPFKELPHMQ